MIELAYYTSGIFIHIFIDQPLKDYWCVDCANHSQL
jgi:hypothetical protein